jgi:hypothetical protein
MPLQSIKAVSDLLGISTGRVHRLAINLGIELIETSHGRFIRPKDIERIRAVVVADVQAKLSRLQEATPA